LKSGLYNAHGHKLRFPLSQKSAICDQAGYDKKQRLVRAAVFSIVVQTGVQPVPSIKSLPAC
jgi:hypothetical protein